MSDNTKTRRGSLIGNMPPLGNFAHLQYPHLCRPPHLHGNFSRFFGGIIIQSVRVLAFNCLGMTVIQRFWRNNMR